ncbi:DUF6886 family protein [Amycolatopsis sp. cg13]|uniref:DUF6886 family protein n=1 Tax=Amycolatopsis sp. cg13 TaxID=3238807 RepID=UPI0035237E5D
MTRTRPGAALLRGRGDHPLPPCRGNRAVAASRRQLPVVRRARPACPRLRRTGRLLLRLHEEAGIQLRVLSNLWPFWDAVTASTAGFSGIRLRNARPRP